MKSHILCACLCRIPSMAMQVSSSHVTNQKTENPIKPAQNVLIHSKSVLPNLNLYFPNSIQHSNCLKVLYKTKD